ncbi:MAG TPA: MOSC N-terminal beta barrel domain-containing protein [Anaerolineales bacterium]|nr:MOSC N-terminal beta barrel domain-containing protein [Anaerolineales bacterium]
MPSRRQFNLGHEGGALSQFPNLQNLIVHVTDNGGSLAVSTQNHAMHVAEIWRYPVKSLAGEQIDDAEIRADGIDGDRRVLVYNEQTRRLITSRTHPKLLGLMASVSKDGEVLIDGRRWDDAESAHAIIRAAGPHARLIQWDGLERFDVLPLLIATDGAIKEFGYDHRRLRPNILIGGVEGLAEREWPGRKMRIGKAVIEFVQLRGRCVMTTYDPDTQEMDPAVLRHIVQKFDGTLALDTAILQGGRISVGDAAELI